MSSFTFGQKTFQTKAPDKGSFPIDHDGNCRRDGSLTALKEIQAAPKNEQPRMGKESPKETEIEDHINPVTGEIGGPKGPEPTRYGDWERKGRVSDF
ncbi:UPF0369 protein C6orf57-like [Tropilaelaps mercedesae]|uniref:Succinate dehydrogenase assembly factor 4, mitochondrial n=1 Tax=Tropilaelaps mercedesae TaxID=418985 RepID=A0A1V9WZH2_9ACAR|nr:UPF0369 protein C6orf57-like [Tropilaelaps mercedesae]